MHLIFFFFFSLNCYLGQKAVFYSVLSDDPVFPQLLGIGDKSFSFFSLWSSFGSIRHWGRYFRQSMYSHFLSTVQEIPLPKWYFHNFLTDLGLGVKYVYLWEFTFTFLKFRFHLQNFLFKQGTMYNTQYWPKTPLWKGLHL